MPNIDFCIEQLLSVCPLYAWKMLNLSKHKTIERMNLKCVDAMQYCYKVRDTCTNALKW